MNSLYEFVSKAQGKKSLSCAAVIRRRTKVIGVTSMELLTVMAMIAILSGIAVPSFISLIQSNRVAGEVNALSGDIQFARSEAIKEGLPVSLCVSVNGSSCLNINTWNKGWIVFSDPNGNQVLEPGELILKKQIPWTNTDTFTADNNISALSYNRDGFAFNLPGTVIWTLHTQPFNASASRCLVVNIAGRQQVQTPSNGNCT